MFNVLLRAVILFVTVFVMMRLLGKRQIGELQPFEFVAALITADLATAPMSNLSTPLLWGILPILALLVFELAISLISLKSLRARQIFCGKPSVLIEKGVIQEKVLSDLRYDLNDLMEQLRSKDTFNISEVNYAILETNGELSILPKSCERTVKTKDLQLNVTPDEYPLALVIDGTLIEKNLRMAGKTPGWLEKKLRSAGFHSYKEILLAQYIFQQELFLQSKAPESRAVSLKVNE